MSGQRIRRISGALKSAALGGIALALAACASGLSDADRAMMRNVYGSQIEVSEQLDLALQDLSREYYVLAQEYQSMGREDLARLAQQRARVFFQRHQNFQNMQSTYRRRLAGLNQGRELEPIEVAAQEGQPAGNQPAQRVAPTPPGQPSAPVAASTTMIAPTREPESQPIPAESAVMPGFAPNTTAPSTNPMAAPQPPPPAPPVPPIPTPTPTPIPPAPAPAPTPAPVPPTPAPSPAPTLW